MREPNKITFGQACSNAFALLTKYWPPALGFVIATGAVDAAFRFADSEMAGLVATSLATLAAGYLLTAHILEREGLETGQAGAVGAYVGVSILGGLGILGGMLLLVVPGLILMSRWMIALPLALMPGYDTMSALRRSWEATRESAGALVGFGIAIFLPTILIAIALPFSPWADGANGSELAQGVMIAEIGIAQFCSALATMGSIAVMQVLIGRDGEFDEIFG